MSRATARSVLGSFTAVPSYVHPAYEHVGADLECLATVDYAQEQTMAEARTFKLISGYGGASATDAAAKPFAYFDGNAVIPVHGLLVNRFPYSWGFITGYNFISDQIAAAVADDDVKTIILDINSYGGTAAGNQEIADQIFATRSVKPILAVIDAAAHSAAYHIASQASKVVITPSGMCGSIGCVYMHADISGMLEKAGIKITFVYKGAHKVDSASEAPLSKEAQARMEEVCGYYYGIFCNNVARGRGIDVGAVEATEAQTYVADEALKLNLVDSIAIPAQALTDFYNDDAGDEDPLDPPIDPPTEKGTEMTEAEMQAAIVKAADDAHTRVTSILGCEEAKDRPALAAALAGQRDVSLATAKTLLSAAAKETAPVAAAAATTTEATTENKVDAAALDKGMKDTPVILPGASADGKNGVTADAKPVNGLLANLSARATPVKAHRERTVLSIGHRAR